MGWAFPGITQADGDDRYGQLAAANEWTATNTHTAAIRTRAAGALHGQLTPTASGPIFDANDAADVWTFRGGVGLDLDMIASIRYLTGDVNLLTGELLRSNLQVVGARQAAVADVPAGGVGAAAGAWDTAANRDAAIASINALLARIRTHGLIAP